MISACREKIDKIISGIGLTIMGAISLLYLVYGPPFAETHLWISWLKFPLFVGELVLAICLVLFFAKLAFSKTDFRKWGWVIVVYSLFVLIKTATGYGVWGPLALRHAALFYYPAFFLFGYVFYRSGFFSPAVIMICILAIICAFTRRVYAYSVLPLLLLFSFLIFKISSKWKRMILVALMLVFVPYEQIFDDGRTRIIGNSIGLLVLFGSFLEISLQKRRKVIIACFSAFFIVVSACAALFSDSNAIQSIIGLDQLYAKWVTNAREIREKGEDFQFLPLEPRLYTDNRMASSMPSRDYLLNKPLNSTVPEPIRESRKAAGEKQEGVIHSALWGPNKDQVKPAGSSADLAKKATPKKRPRSLATARNNILFRIYIWQDVIREVWQNKLVLGQAFGYPFRSRNLEILRWAMDAWLIDGWIAIHNSYLDLIYRGGVLGLLMVVFLFRLVRRFLSRSVRDRDLSGVVVVSLLCVWMIYACFIEFLQLPYTAIPFWSFLGVALAYFQERFRDRET